MVWLFVLCGVVSMTIRAREGRGSVAMMTGLPIVPQWLTTGLHGAAPVAEVATVFAYFASAGLFVFGSGLAIVPFLHGGVVLEHHWLTERQFLDAVAVALITPGPVVITVAFIGYLVAGVAGATAAAAGVFAPVYILTVLFAPHFDRWKDNRRVRGFVDGVTAAATGAIAGAVVVLGRRAIIDVTTASIAVVVLIVLLRVRKIPEPLVILAAGVVGVILKRS
jgi:chromate transporter